MRVNTPAEVDPATYDHYVDAYTAQWNQYLIRRVVEEFKLRGDHGARLVDMGTGTARTLIDLAALPEMRDVAMTGIDYYDDMVQQARMNVEAAGLDSRISIAQGDVHSLSLPSAQFDALIGRSVIHHWENPVVAFREIRRILAPGGFALIHEPSRTPSPEALAEFNRQRAAAGIHPVNLMGKFTPAETREMLAEAGLSALSHVTEGVGNNGIGFEVLISVAGFTVDTL